VIKICTSKLGETMFESLTITTEGAISKMLDSMEIVAARALQREGIEEVTVSAHANLVVGAFTVSTTFKSDVAEELAKKHPIASEEEEVGGFFSKIKKPDMSKLPKPTMPTMASMPNMPDLSNVSMPNIPVPWGKKDEEALEDDNTDESGGEVDKA